MTLFRYRGKKVKATEDSWDILSYRKLGLLIEINHTGVEIYVLGMKETFYHRVF